VLFLIVCLNSLTIASKANGDTTTLTLNSNPDCVALGPDRVDCVARGSDGALWHDAWISNSSGSHWNGWESFGGILTQAPSITSSAPGQLDMFVSGPDKALWHIVWNGSLGPWVSLGGTLASGPDCTSAATGQIDCFARAPDNTLSHISYSDETWSGWESLGGILTSGPGTASAELMGQKLLAVFVSGPDKALWMIDNTGNGWSAWQKRGGVLTSRPDAVMITEHLDSAQTGVFRYDVVVRGLDNGIWWKWYRSDVGWSTGCQGCDGYEKLSGTAGSAPTIVSKAWNSLDVFALGTDGKLYHRGWDGSTWSWWDAVPMTLAPVATSTTSMLSSYSESSSTSSESSTTSSAATNSTTMEASNVVTNLTETAQSTSGSATDIMGTLQQHSLLVVGGFILVLIVAVFIARSRRKPGGSRSTRQPSTNIFCPQCGVQIPADNNFCPKCGGKAYD